MPLTIDAGDNSNNDLGGSRVDESENLQINQQFLFLNQAYDDVSTVEFNGESSCSSVNIHTNDSEEEEKSDHNENSF